MEISFNEKLTGNLNPAEPTIVNENGVDVTSSFLGGSTTDAITAGAQKVTLSFTTPAKVSGKFAFSFPAALVSDQAETANTSAAFNYTVDFGSSSDTFSLPAATPPSATGNVITVEFGTAVKGGAVANSATDLANYTLSGKPLPEGTTIVLDANQDTATITLPDESIPTTDSNAVFTVANIKSLNGASLNTYTGTVAVEDNVSPVLNSAVLNNDGTITIGFSETLAAATLVDADDLVLTVNDVVVDDAEYTVAAGTGSDAGKFVVTALLTFSDAGTPADNTDDVLFLDADGDGTADAGEVVFVTGAAATAAQDGDTANLKSLAVTSLKIGTIASGTPTGADAEGNTLKLDVVKTVK